MLFEAVQAAGGRPIMCPTGHSNFKSLMPKHGVIFGGEMSGHYFFNDRYFGYDDALYAMMRILELMTLGYDVGQFLSLIPRFYASSELKIPCDDAIKFDVIDQMKKYLDESALTYSEVDGIRLSLNEGWWLIRASNTSPYLVARIESYTKQNYDLVKDHLNNILLHFIPGANLISEMARSSALF
jgi:phosphomannomutase